MTFDPAKDERNKLLRNLPFDKVRTFGWTQAIYGLSARQEIAATRFVVIGEIDGLLYTVVFILENADCRIISLRRSRAKERKRWLSARTRS